MNSSYPILLSKLDEFIRKYYRNQLVKGLIYGITLCLSIFIVIAAAAYFGNFGIAIRTVLFYCLIAGCLGIFINYIVIPLLKLNHIGKTLGYEDAARIIGKHFSEIEDKLLNVLQLNSQKEKDPFAGYYGMELIEAGIEQKIKAIRPIPINIAIDIGKNKKYLPWLALPVFIILLIMLLRPALLQQGTTQLVHYNTFYAKAAPFHFILENKDLNVMQQKDITINLKISGNEIPENVFIVYEGSNYKMDKSNPVSFEYTFRNVQHDEQFKFNAAGYESEEYKLRALPEPLMVNFNVRLHYPPYTGRKDETLHNTGDLSIPQGTIAQWEFSTVNTEGLHLNFMDSTVRLKPTENDKFFYNHRFMRSENYSVSTNNSFVANHDSVSYSAQVIPDLFPSIDVDEKQDSLSAKYLYFNGTIKDDYGFTRLNFTYRIYNPDDSSHGTTTRIPLSIEKSVTRQPFYFYWNMDTLKLQPGNQIEYYFEVWDNDGVNGAKSSKSKIMLYKIPTLEEIEKATDENNKEIQNDISKTIQQAEVLQNKMENAREDLYDKKDLSWADKKKISDLLEQQQELEKKAEDISKQNKEKNDKQWEYQKRDSALAQEQEELQNLFDRLANDSLKKKMAELEKMLEKMNKDQIQEQLDKIAMDNQDLKKEMQRMLELFKQAEFQQQLTQNIQQLDSLSKKQEQLSKATNAQSQEQKSTPENADKQALQKKQEELNNKFNELGRNLQDLEKKNSELEQPTPYKNPGQDEQNIQQQMQNSSEQLAKNKSGKASQSQHNASQGMKKMEDELSQMQANMEMEQDEANTDALRAILNNLVQLSFGQEDLMNRLNANGKISDIAKTQKELQDNAGTIADSLYKLSKKTMQIEGIVNQEMSKINYNMKQAIGDMEQHRGPEAASRQQFSMTSINNLALMLSEVLEQMQNSEKQSDKHTPGAGSCKKPGGRGHKNSMADMRQMQEQLSKQLDRMNKAIQGKNPGNKNKGGADENSEGMDEQLAKLAAQQQYIREQMQAAEDEMSQDKKSGGEFGEIAQQMKETENDILNNQITETTLNRQREIMKHMLEYEKSEQTKEQSPQFESHTAKKQFNTPPASFKQYYSQKNKQDELLNTLPPDLTPYYKNKVDTYFNSLSQ